MTNHTPYQPDSSDNVTQKNISQLFIKAEVFIKVLKKINMRKKVHAYLSRSFGRWEKSSDAQKSDVKTTVDRDSGPVWINEIIQLFT